MQSKILLISDTPDWAFARECDAIKEKLSYKYNIDKAYIDVCYNGNKNNVKDYYEISHLNLKQYDLIVIRELSGLHHIGHLFNNIDRNKVAITISANHFYDKSSWSEFYKSKLNVYKHVICISDEIYKKANEFYKDRDVFIYFAPMGIDTKFFQNFSYKKNKLFTVGWGGNPDHIEGEDHKRFYSLIVPVIRKCKDNYKFKIAASNIKRVNVFNELKFYSNVEVKRYSYDSMPSFYNSVDCMLIGSESEAVATIMAESVCCGRPVITTDVGYNKNIIIDKVNGLILPNSVDDFVNGIEYFKNYDYKKVFQLNEFIAHNVLDWGVLINFIDSVFMKILDYNKINNDMGVIANMNNTDKIDLRKDLTVFVISVGDRSFDHCIKCLDDQDSIFNIDIIKNYAPMSAAFQEMINRCKTKYYIQVDEDMLLFTNSVSNMYNQVIRSRPNEAILCFPLWDKHLDRFIFGVKIYKNDILKMYPYRDVISCEMDQVNRMKSAGYVFNTFPEFSQIKSLGDCFGFHGAYFTEKTAYERYKDLIEKECKYGWIGFINEYFNEFFQRWIDTSDRVDLFAFLGMLVGMTTDVTIDLGEKDFRKYNDLFGFNKLKDNISEIEKCLRYSNIFKAIEQIYNILDLAVDSDTIALSASKIATPTELILYLTSRCNSRCWFCRREEYACETNNYQDFTIDNLKDVLDKFKYIKSACLAGFGEPLLNNNLFDIIKYLRGLNISSSIISNGMLLKSKVSDIINNPPNQITISLNAYDSEGHSKVTRTNTFDEVIDGIKLLKNSCSVRLGLSFVCHKDNYRDIPKYIEIANNLNASYIHLVNILPHFGIEDSDDFFNKVITDKDLDIINEIEQYKSLPGAGLVECWPCPLSVEGCSNNCQSPFISVGVAAIHNKIFIGGCRRIVPPAWNCYETCVGEPNIKNPYNTKPLNDLRYSMLTSNFNKYCKLCFGRIVG